jgi:hypothetical protein
MPRVFQHLATFQLKLAQVRHLFARKPGAQPLLGHGMFIFLPGKTHFTRMDFKELSQRIATNRVLQSVFRIRTQMLAFAIRRKARSSTTTKSSGLAFSIPAPAVYRAAR